VAEIETSLDGGVLTITLNRPDVLNAFGRSMQDEFRSTLREAREPAVRAVILTGKGRGFCVGQDLKEFEAGADIPEQLRALYNPNIQTLYTLEKPVVAAINGATAGGGIGLALACDIRVASDAATFVPAFINIALVPDMGGTFFAARILGYSRAFDWLSSGRRLTAAEAHAWGLVSEVVDADRVLARAGEIAVQLAALPTRAIGMTKRLLQHAHTATLGEQLELEAQLQRVATGSEDFAEGVAAFLEKREPRFAGR
jgi:2-(1,2-epoxy-1,2-dihydrophenyl)acetyl-CoA isomerase